METNKETIAVILPPTIVSFPLFDQILTFNSGACVQVAQALHRLITGVYKQHYRPLIIKA